MFYTLEFGLFDVAAAVFVKNLEDFLDFFRWLWGEPTQLKELLVAERVRSWEHKHNNDVQSQVSDKEHSSNSREQKWVRVGMIWDLTPSGNWNETVAAVQAGDFPALFYAFDLSKSRISKNTDMMSKTFLSITFHPVQFNMCSPTEDCVENVCACKCWQTLTVFDCILNGFSWKDWGEWHFGPVASKIGKKKNSHSSSISLWKNVGGISADLKSCKKISTELKAAIICDHINFSIR